MASADPLEQPLVNEVSGVSAIQATWWRHPVMKISLVTAALLIGFAALLSWHQETTTDAQSFSKKSQYNDKGTQQGMSLYDAHMAPTPAPTSAAQLLSCSMFHTCAIHKNTSKLLCWGENSYGKTKVPSELGAALTVSSGSDASVICAIQKITRKVLCWGDNGYTQIDPSPYYWMGPALTVSVGGFTSCAIQKSTSKVLCWGNSYRRTTVPRALGAALTVSCGNVHTCAIKKHNGNKVLCWGDNPYGQTAVPGALGAALTVSSGASHTCAIQKSTSKVLCWGDNGYGKTKVPGELGAALTVSSGDYHTCAIQKSTSNVLCWGSNNDGQTTVPSALGAALTVSSGARHTCAIQKSTSKVLCWGDNRFGQTTVPRALGTITPAPTPAPLEEGKTYIIQQANTRRMIRCKQAYTKCFTTTDVGAADWPYWRVKKVPGGFWTLRPAAKPSMGLEGWQDAKHDFAVRLGNARYARSTWKIEPVMGGWEGSFTVQNKATGKYLDAYEDLGHKYGLVTRPKQENDSQKWIFTVQS